MDKVDKKLVTLMLFFVVTFGVFMAVVVFNKPLSQFTRATSENKPSAEKSLIILNDIYPVKVGQKTTLNVFAISTTGTPIKNKTITLKTTIGQILQNNLATDDSGRAVFTLTSDIPGDGQVDAIIDNSIKIKQAVSVKFIQ